MGKVTDVVKTLKEIRSNYEVESDEYKALTVSIKSVTEWGNLNAEVEDLGLWGFEDVDARFQILKAFKNKVHTLVHRKLKDIGVR